MRAHRLAAASLLVGSGFFFSFVQLAHADSNVSLCDVLDTSTATHTDMYATAYCGVQTPFGGKVLTAQATLTAIELNIAVNPGGTQYLMFTTGAGNFVGQSHNDYGETVNFTGLGTGLHTFILAHPLTFPAGVTPSFHLYAGGQDGFGATLGFGQPTVEMYGSNIGGGQQAVFYQKWFWTVVAPPDPCAVPGSCASNVLFLPGIESSRLYDSEGGEKRLWEPGLNDTLQGLYLNAAGQSIRSDVYTKVGDVVDETPVTGANVYKSFIAKMNGLVSAGTINAWEASPYDWRLSIDDILSRGAQTGSHISYIDATSTPYIVQELKRLAATSKTHKVTVVAHSNGGLVAKRLTELLGAEAATLIDKIIFVAVPQAGTPAAVAAALHGYDQNFGFGPITFVSQATSRTFASTTPMAYNLLPSSRYFTQVDNPIITFDPSLTDWISRYGATIHNEANLRTFLTSDFGRVNAQAGDIDQPIQLSSTLLSGAEALHTDLDNWAPPAGVQLVQIAGWGVPTTVSGLAYTKKGTGVRAEPGFTIDGDGTVVVPSALWTSISSGAFNYWMNLRSYNSTHPVDSGFGFAPFNHSRILETTQLLDFLSDQITSTSTKQLSNYVYLTASAPVASDLRLRYALHSPLTLNLYDSAGHHTGVSTTTGQVEEQIPGTYYTQFGDTKYIFSDASSSARIVMNGYATGTFTFNIDQYSGDMRTASTTFQNIPTTASTVVSLGVQSDISTLSPMSIDKNGDGVVDATLAPKLGGTVTIDTTPPEIQISFSTSTQALAFTAIDDSGSAALSSTTTYPVLKKGQKRYEGIATTTLTARDASGNTTVLVYTERLPSPDRRDVITPVALISNGVTTAISGTAISYKWHVERGVFKLFAALLRTPAVIIESHYKPKKNQTVLMTKPADLDDSDTDDADIRPTKQILPGMVIPSVTTKKGSLIINY